MDMRQDFDESVFYSLTAEVDVIGGLLFDNNSFNYISEFLKRYHFYSPLHGVIFDVIESLINKRRVAEPLTVANNLQSEKLFIEAGGVDYLYKIAKKYAESSFTINLQDRGKLIEGLYYERKLIEILKATKDDLYNKTKAEEPSEKIEKLEKALYDLTEESESGKGGFLSLSTLFNASIAHIKKTKEAGGVRGIPVGFKEIDDLIFGFQKSDLIIIAGRPSMGKTSFAVSIAINVAKFLAEKKKKGKAGVIAIFSLEMSSEQLATRILSVFSNINSNELLSGKLDTEQMKRLVRTADEFKDLPLYLDDTAAITISMLRTRARRLKKQSGLDMIVVDYLQLLRSGGKQENRVQEVSEITQGLKAIAKELDVPVVALSQLSRNVESREDKRPQLQDLRESGSIEQDADIVMFLYREEYYLERSKPSINNPESYEKWKALNGKRLEAVQNIAEVIVAKHRNGPVGSASLRFSKETTKFDNLEDKDRMRSREMGHRTYVAGDQEQIRKAFDDRAIHTEGLLT